MRHFFVIFLVLVGLISLLTTEILAFECKSPLDYSELTEEYDYVFVAQVQDIDPAENEDHEIVKFNIYSLIKGEIPEHLFEIKQEKNSFSGVDFKIGITYNVFVNDGNPMSTNSCTTLPLAESEKYVNYPNHNLITCSQGTALVDGMCVGVVQEDTMPPIDCLIATASYGSELAPQVQMLREIRDNVLLSTDSGALFMNGFNAVYYSFSPEIAHLENENKLFKEAVKLFITPMISALSI